MKKYNGKTMTEILAGEMPTPEMIEFYSNSDIWVFEDSDGKVYEFDRPEPQDQALMYIHESFEDFVKSYEEFMKSVIQNG